MFSNDRAAQYRADLARLRFQRYQFASRVGIHPSKLSQILNGHVALTPELEARIAAELVKIEAERNESPR